MREYIGAGLALIALAVLYRKSIAAPGSAPGSGVWQDPWYEGGSQNGTPVPQMPNYNPTPGWEEPTSWYDGGSFMPATSENGNTANTTGGYLVPNPDPNKDYYAHLPPLEWYINVMGLSEAAAHAQASFELTDADFAAGKATMNQRDQALLRLEIIQARERGDDTRALENLLAYLVSNPQYSRWDLRTGVLP